jgi:hypothetical protein
MRRTAIGLSTLLISLLLVAPVAHGRDEVIVDVTSICASARATGGTAPASAPVVDPRLSAFAKKLQSLFAYTRYSFLGKSQTQTPFGRASTIQLPERFSLEVQPEPPRRGDDNRIEMMVTLLRDGGEGRGESGRGRPEAEVVLRTRIRLENGGTVLLGGPPIAAGVLILALSARS